MFHVNISYSVQVEDQPISIDTLSISYDIYRSMSIAIKVEDSKNRILLRMLSQLLERWRSTRDRRIIMRKNEEIKCWEDLLKMKSMLRGELLLINESKSFVYISCWAACCSFFFSWALFLALLSRGHVLSSSSSKISLTYRNYCCSVWVHVGMSTANSLIRFSMAQRFLSKKVFSADIKNYMSIKALTRMKIITVFRFQEPAQTWAVWTLVVMGTWVVW